MPILFVFIKYLFTIGITEAILKPIATRVTLFTIREYLPAIYEQLDQKGFLEKVANGDSPGAEFDIELAFISAMERLPKPDEIASLLVDHSLLRAAARIHQDRQEQAPEV